MCPDRARALSSLTLTTDCQPPAVEGESDLVLLTVGHGDRRADARRRWRVVEDDAVVAAADGDERSVGGARLRRRRGRGCRRTSRIGCECVEVVLHELAAERADEELVGDGDEDAAQVGTGDRADLFAGHGVVDVDPGGRAGGDAVTGAADRPRHETVDGDARPGAEGDVVEPGEPVVGADPVAEEGVLLAGVEVVGLRS